MPPLIIFSAVVLGAMGLMLGVLLAVAGRIFAVRVDPRIQEVISALAGLNCGVCGYPGCAAFAEALVAGKAKARQCAPGGQETVRKVAAILGRAETPPEPRVAVVRCQGGKKEAADKAVYRGVWDCAAAEILEAGAKACVYGCLGMGTCVRACPFGALRMTGNLLPEVAEAKCTACGRCVEACPRRIIALIPARQKIFLGCVSRDRGKRVKDACARGCTACGVCALPKITPSGKVTLRGNLPEFPPDWEDYRAAAEKCPSGCFVIRSK